jgi:hypothetical protein
MALGKKTIELRPWNTKFRGEFLIHAGRNIEEAACRELGIDPNSLTRGAIIGKAYLYDVKEYKSQEELMADKDKHLATGKYLQSKYGFFVKDAVKFDKPIPMKGQLNFFEVDIDGPEV